MPFSLQHQDRQTAARLGRLRTPHGDIETPVFMPVGTRGTVKAMTPAELKTAGFRIVLGNTYHLNLRPGMEIIEKIGGLHRFMGWDGALLTDSGGYQVFSLSKLRKITGQGVHFQSHLDGAPLFLGPVEAMRIQRTLGSDIAMVFDDCTPWPCSRQDAAASLDTTLRWARQCREQEPAPGQAVFGIVQGSVFEDLRRESAQALVGMEFDGYAIGGLSVGEPEEEMYKVLDCTLPELPARQPRYLMGVGTPPQIVEAVARGVDMFDCVLPTRIGRNGSAFTADGCIPVKAARYKADTAPIEKDCQCHACRHFSKAYIRHLLNTDEILGLRLMTIHNLHFYKHLIEQIRQSIEARRFPEFRRQFRERYEVSRQQPQPASL